MRTIWDERGRWALLPVRLMVGFGFAAHGLAKLGRGPEHFAVILQTLGVPLPNVAAWVTSLLELGGGLCLMVGLAVTPLVAPLAMVMLTAMFGVHLRYGFSSIRLEALTPTGARFGPIGYELNLLYLSGLVALGLGGAGPASLDGVLSRRGRSSSSSKGSSVPGSMR